MTRRMDGLRQPTMRMFGAGSSNEEDGQAEAMTTRMVGVGNDNEEYGWEAG